MRWSLGGGLNDQPPHNAERDADSSGGRISSHRRDLTNIALEIIAAGHIVERLSKLVDKAPSPRRRLEILRACDEIAEHRAHIEATEKHLREVAEDTKIEHFVVTRRRSVWTKKPAADDTPSDGIPILDASEVHIDAEPGDVNEFALNDPTLVDARYICPGCAGEQFRLEDTVQPPASHEEAWRPGPIVNGKPLWGEGACRGNKIHYWCKAAVEHGFTGMLVIISLPGKGGMFVQFFPDRRIEARPVAVERRGLPKGKP